MMTLTTLKSYMKALARRFLLVTIITAILPTGLFSQSLQSLEIYRFFDVNSPTADTGFLGDIKRYIQDTLFFGGGRLSNVEYTGSPKGVGLFEKGADIGISRGLMISNGYVMTSILVDGGKNRTGAQAIPNHDSLGPYTGGAGGGLKDSDMDYMLGVIIAGDTKPDTAVDPSVITFKFKPFYNSIHLNYVFASEEYLYEHNPHISPPPPMPVDIDMTDSVASDFMAILVKRTPGEINVDNIASNRGVLGEPPYIPISVKFLNHTFGYPGNYFPNYYPDKSFIFDGYTVPYDIHPFPFDTSISKITPCRTYWVKIAVADHPNKIVASGYHLAHQMNSAVFLKQYSLMSGYGLDWTMEAAIDNPDFAGDTSLVEGGCSNIIMTVRTNVLPRDTMFIRFRVDNADLSDYIVTPPLVQDSLIMIPDSVMEYTFTISAVDDGINEGSAGIDKWFLRYQIDPCDVPTTDTSGFGQSTSGYTGLFKVYVRDYNPYDPVTKTYGPVPSNIYHCGNDITVTITDLVDDGIPPYNYVWSHPVVPQLGTGDNFTTPISASPDYIFCTITDRCSGKPGYEPGHDTVIIYSTLEVQASSDFQLCQNGASDIKVQSTNVGRDFTTVWYFQGNPVGYDSIYTVDWDEYGIYAPNTIVFTCVVTDECGNTDSDEVQATFFPVVEITGVPLICIGETISLTCSGALEYEWHYGSLGGPVLGTLQTLNYTPTSAGFHTICVSIINECGEPADTCFSFEVSQLICAVRLNNTNNFSVCPNVPFNLMELNAYDGWEWSWIDDGTTHTASGQTINLALTDAGVHQVSVTAYNIHGCYHTLEFQVTVYPYAEPEAFTSLSSVCIDYPTELSIQPNGPVSFTDYFWTATPPDASLSGQQNNPTPTVTPQVTTTYKCRITDNHGCLDSASVLVNVRPKLAGNILSSPDFSCTDKPVQISFQPIVEPLPGATYAWTLDDGVPSTSNLATPPQVIWSTPGQKNITLHIEESGCEETFYYQYTVYPDPLASFSATNASGCQPIEVSFNNSSSNLENPTYHWDFGDGNTDTGVNPSHIYPNPGTYDVTLTVTNSTGCINTLTVYDMVEVYEVPVADFEADPQAATIDNPTIHFTNLINIPFRIIEWDFGDGGTNTTEADPRHTYGAPGNYMVVMYTETEFGCWDRDTLEIGIVEDIKIFVPNAFTPDGDGLNDCFSVGGTTGDIIEVFQVIIYSRWGQQIHESKVENPECVWDGRDQQGNLLPPDTYIFRIFGKNFRGARKVYEGMVTIVK